MAAGRMSWLASRKGPFFQTFHLNPGIPTTIKTMGVSITTIVYLRVLIIQIGSTIISMVVEAQGEPTINCPLESGPIEPTIEQLDISSEPIGTHRFSGGYSLVFKGVHSG